MVFYHGGGGKLGTKTFWLERLREVEQEVENKRILAVFVSWQGPGISVVLMHFWLCFHGDNIVCVWWDRQCQQRMGIWCSQCRGLWQNSKWKVRYFILLLWWPRVGEIQGLIEEVRVVRRISVGIKYGLRSEMLVGLGNMVSVPSLEREQAEEGCSVCREGASGRLNRHTLSILGWNK